MNDPIIGLDLWYVFVAICNVLILYSVLKKLLFQKVKEVIDGRENEVASAFKEAEDAKAEAIRLKAEYEASIASAKDKASEIIKEATTSASKRADALVKQAEMEVTSMKRKAEVAVSVERQRVMTELTSDISQLVTLAAAKVIEKEINADDHKQLIQNFVEKVGE